MRKRPRDPNIATGAAEDRPPVAKVPLTKKAGSEAWGQAGPRPRPHLPGIMAQTPQTGT